MTSWVLYIFEKNIQILNQYQVYIGRVKLQHAYRIIIEYTKKKKNNDLYTNKMSNIVQVHLIVCNVRKNDTGKNSWKKSNFERKRNTPVNFLAKSGVILKEIYGLRVGLLKLTCNKPYRAIVEDKNKVKCQKFTSK